MITNIHSRLGRMTPWLAMASMMTVNTASEAASSSCVSTELASPKFDKYGGWNGVTTTATGRFRTEKIDGRWWIITPEGHGMWINGPSNITPHNIDKNGVDEYNAKIIRKYGSEEN